jgi:hypothetical protein
MSDNPYLPPGGDLPPEHRIRPERGRGPAAAGLGVLILGTLCSSLALGAVVRAFGTLSDSGQADPAVLADGIASVMWLTMLGMVATAAGGVLTAMAVFGAGNREGWFFHLGWMISALQLVTFPLGTPFGILLLFGFLMKRQQFSAVRTPGEGSS